MYYKHTRLKYMFTCKNKKRKKQKYTKYVT